MDPAPSHEPAGTTDESVLDRVRRSAADLLAGLPRPPRTLSIRDGEVAIDIEWPETPPPQENGSTSHALAPEPSAALDDPARKTLTAQAVGVFYRAPEPGAVPFVAEGDTVLVGQQVAIIEAMKLMIPVEAELSGRVVEVLKKDGEPVEYGEALFALATDENS
ncbi:MAG: acetyl-CoA carboxylase biotin carboxyl carrier protein [Sciscionella sp.]